MTDPVDRSLRPVENGLLGISLFALVVMMVVMVTDVIMRYVIGAPLSWSVGFISDYALIAMFFLGLPYTVREGAHVHIDLLYRRLGNRARRVVAAVALVLSAGFMAVIVYGGGVKTVDAFRHGDAPMPGASDLPWPVWTSTVMVPLGAGVVVLRLLHTLFTGREREIGELIPEGPGATSRDASPVEADRA